MWRLILAGVCAVPPVALTLVMAPLVAILSIPACALLLCRPSLFADNAVVEDSKTKANNQNVTGSEKNTSSKAEEETIQTDDSPSCAPNTTTTTTSKSAPLHHRSNRQQPLQRRQVVITGGSSGIGLAIAMAAAVDPTVVRIVLMARDSVKLAQAQGQVTQSAAASVLVETRSVNVTDAEAVHRVARDVLSWSSSSSPIVLATHLFLCAAGEPHALPYHQITPLQYASVTQINQLGSMYVAQAFCQLMHRGTVTFTGSMGGQVGVYGYSAYCPTKFALRGFAETLHMEFLAARSPSKQIDVQVAYPPDTDTPGYALENVNKPVETQLISQVAGLASPQDIGRTMWREATAKHPRFNVYFNFDGFLLCTLTAGFSPVSTLMDALAQVSILSFTRWIALFYLADWHRILRNYYNRSQKTSHANDCLAQSQAPNETSSKKCDDKLLDAAKDESGKTSPSGAHKND